MLNISGAGVDLNNRSGSRVSMQYVRPAEQTEGRSASFSAPSGEKSAQSAYSSDGFAPAVSFSQAAPDPSNPAGIYKSLFFPAQTAENAVPEQADAENAAAALDGKADSELPDATASLAEGKSAAEVAEDGECQTCQNRKYQDGSDDPGVSFKTAGSIDKSVAASTIRSHEQEHVSRNAAKAEREGREVVSSRVVLHTGICPECGDVYYSGGTTTTVTRNAYDKAMAADPKNEANVPKTTVDTTI